MSVGIWIRIAIYLLGALALSLLVWFGGPLIAISKVRPLDPDWIRWLLIALIFLIVAAVVVWELISRRNASAKLAEGIVGKDAEPEGDARVLTDKMADALSTLRKSGGAKGDYLYDLPWYVLIGPPGSGKTTALINSGLKFPLARGVSPEAVAGAGGTRYCDWWFTEDAVMIDTAGRYTTQDSDAKADQKSWLSFLQLLKDNRPKQPINGVLVCISLEDLLKSSPAEIGAHADAIRGRLMELHDHLKVDFPVYALFTKADLVSGFMEFFAHLNEAGRRAVWGVTFQTDDKTRNMIGEVASEFDPLIERLNQELVDRLQEEPTPTAKVQIFGFPSQISVLKRPIVDFLTRIFEPTRYQSNATLRGYYFTSGTQEGTPIDQLIGAMSRQLGASEPGRRLSGLGRSYFLTDLITKVVIGEAGWVSTNRAAVRRGWMLKTAAYAALVVASLGLTGAWTVSYFRNIDLIGQVFGAVSQFRATAGPVREETLVSDRDLTRILPALQHLRVMPTGHDQRDRAIPTSETFGLSQWDRLHSASANAYHVALNRMLRTRLMYRLEEYLRENLATPANLAEPLGVYLMLAGRNALNKDAVVAWHQRDWRERLLRGPQFEEHRRALENHLSAMLDMPATQGLNAVEADEYTIQQAQNALARMSVADRAFQMLVADASAHRTRDWTASRRGGQDVALVFEATGAGDLEEVRVPFFYTYAGFQEAFIRRIPVVQERLRRELEVLGGPSAPQAVQAQHEALPGNLLTLYEREFVNAWRTALARLRMKSLLADRPRYVGLQAAAAATSPISAIIESIRDETALTRERPAPPPQPGQQATPQQLAAIDFGRPPGEIPGARIEQAFRQFHTLMEGDRGRRPIDDLIRALTDIRASLAMINDPAQSAQGQVLFRQNLQSFRAANQQFPAPFGAMLQTVANTADQFATGDSVARILQGLTEQVTRVCQTAIAGRYPFTRASDRDMTLQEFQRLLGPGGTIDRFFTVNLAPMADTTRPQWTWNATHPVGRQMSPQLLQSFQRAAQLREAFFPGGAPGFTFAARNLTLGQGVDLARLQINGATLTNERPPAPPPPAGFSWFGQPANPPPPPPEVPPPIGSFQWPGPQGLSAALITVAPEIAGRVNRLQRDGVWAVFRILEAGSMQRQGEAIIARFNVGGRELAYQINVAGVVNPLLMVPQLREFQCPTAQ